MQEISYPFPKSWLFPASLSEAKRAQEEIAENALLRDCIEGGEKEPLSIVGMDVSNNLYDPDQMIFASVVALKFPSMELFKKESIAAKQDSFPYIPGFLGFREAPALYSAFQKLDYKPDLIIVDGHGLAHPRKCGIATHIGVLLDIPTIGVAKNILVGSLNSPLSEEIGSSTPLLWKDEVIGMALKTKKRANPLIISIGHKITLDRSIKIILNCLKGYRLPEPTRMAHNEANHFRRAYQKEKPYQ